MLNQFCDMLNRLGTELRDMKQRLDDQARCNDEQGLSSGHWDLVDAQIRDFRRPLDLALGQHKELCDLAERIRMELRRTLLLKY